LSIYNKPTGSASLNFDEWKLNSAPTCYVSPECERARGRGIEIKNLEIPLTTVCKIFKFDSRGACFPADSHLFPPQSAPRCLKFIKYPMCRFIISATIANAASNLNFNSPNEETPGTLVNLPHTVVFAVSPPIFLHHLLLAPAALLQTALLSSKTNRRRFPLNCNFVSGSAAFTLGRQPTWKMHSRRGFLYFLRAICLAAKRRKTKLVEKSGGFHQIELYWCSFLVETFLP
jgi:hypothetical protein